MMTDRQRRALTVGLRAIETEPGCIQIVEIACVAAFPRVATCVPDHLLNLQAPRTFKVHE